MTVPVLIRPGEAPAATAMRRRSREPDPSWVIALNDAFPPQEGRRHRLRIVWEPGEDVGVRGLPRIVDRWFLYELAPMNDGMVRLGIKELLDGPAPIEMLRYDTFVRRWVPTETGRWPFFSQPQWEMYRETDCVAIPCWVIQGDHGGHAFQFSENYAALCRFRKMPDAPPAPGELPYAPFDQRVIRALQRNARLVKFGNDLEASHAQWRWFDRDEARLVRDEMLKTIDECFTMEQAKEVEGAIADLGIDRPIVHGDLVQDYEDAAQRFLETD